MAAETERQMRLREEVELELHALCQPLTTLRCRLDLAMMLSGTDAREERQALREAVMECLDDMKRVFASVERLRARLLSGGL